MTSTALTVHSRLFEWKLIGKKEMYIPYHNYSFDDESLDYDTLLHCGSPQPGLLAL